MENKEIQKNVNTISICAVGILVSLLLSYMQLIQISFTLTEIENILNK